MARYRFDIIALSDGLGLDRLAFGCDADTFFRRVFPLSFHIVFDKGYAISDRLVAESLVPSDQRKHGMDRAHRFFHVLFFPGYLHLGAAGNDVYVKRSLEQLYVFVIAAEQTHRVFYSVYLHGFLVQYKMTPLSCKKIMCSDYIPPTGKLCQSSEKRQNIYLRRDIIITFT